LAVAAAALAAAGGGGRRLLRRWRAKKKVRHSILVSGSVMTFWLKLISHF